MARKTRNHLAQLDPRVRRWLDVVEPDVCEEDDPSDEHFDRWYLERASSLELVDAGGVLVDRALLGTRFACVPERCSPARDRGPCRSCCADVTLYVSPAERRRLGRHRRALHDYLASREPRLASRMKKRNGRVPSFWLDEDGESLCRPGGRCVFSALDAHGRIRCHLHPLHRKLGIDQTDLQPIPCRLFPLVLVQLPRARLLITVNNRQNFRCFGGRHPRCYPCLSDPDLPALLRTMRPTLEWLFGAGFTRLVRRAGATK